INLQDGSREVLRIAYLAKYSVNSRVDDVAASIRVRGYDRNARSHRLDVHEPEGLRQRRKDEAIGRNPVLMEIRRLDLVPESERALEPRGFHGFCDRAHPPTDHEPEQVWNLALQSLGDFWNEMESFLGMIPPNGDQHEATLQAKP